jgi:V-type H+-transporting ATPase subunit a
MMFGDMGHGSILCAIAIILVFGAEKFKNGPLADVVPLRYLFLFMGISATYCGFVYNEFFAMQTEMFHSCYRVDYRDCFGASIADEDSSGRTAIGECGAYYYKRLHIDCTYPVGTDPIWGIATNKLTYINGIKMKLSVIFGVLHMTMGILHKGTNTIYFRDWPSFFTEVVAGLIILLGLFGWMDLLIMAKWLHPLNIDDDSPATDKRCHDQMQPAPGCESTDPNECLIGPT